MSGNLYVTPFPLCIFVTLWQVHDDQGRQVGQVNVRMQFTLHEASKSLAPPPNQAPSPYGQPSASHGAYPAQQYAGAPGYPPTQQAYPVYPAAPYGGDIAKGVVSPPAR